MLLTAFLVVLAALTSRPVPHDPITTKVTFGREVRAILATRCARCHTTRGSAPMPLTTYEEVRPWARAIKEQVLTRRMPKWHAARGYGAFANDPTLTPLESALLVAWVDGGLPRGDAVPPISPVVPVSFRREDDVIVPVRPGQATAAIHTPVEWIAGWSFEPGDPLIASVTIDSSAGRIGTWVAGDRPVVLPPESGARIAGAIRLSVERRAAADFEVAVPPRRSVLRLRPLEAVPAHRVWFEEVACGAPRMQTEIRSVSLLAVRPVLSGGGSAHIWMQRPGAPASIVGWFRDFDPAFARSYWLLRPLDLSFDARLQADAPCTLQLTLTR